MKCVVVSAIFEFSADTSTDFNTVIQSHREVALIEQIMEIGAQEDSVARKMRSKLAVRLDVRCLQRGQSLLPSDRASPIVDVCDCDSKGTLPQPWLHEVWFAIPLGRDILSYGPTISTGATLEAFLNLHP